MKEISKLDEYDHQGATFTAGDASKLAGVSYRQLGEWDAKGAASAAREEKRSWRRFTPREIFALMVCSEMRKKFGVPVDRLAYVRKFMLQDDADHFSAAVELISLLGVNVFIVTDLEKTFFMEPETEIEALFCDGFFHGESEQAYLMLNVNPLINRVLACLKKPIHLGNHGRGHAMTFGHRAQTSARDENEQQVLDLIRDGQFSKIEVGFGDKNRMTIRSVGRMNADTANDLEKLLAASGYQTLTVTQAKGRIVHVEQEISRRTRG